MLDTAFKKKVCVTSNSVTSVTIYKTADDKFRAKKKKKYKLTGKTVPSLFISYNNHLLNGFMHDGISVYISQ